MPHWALEQIAFLRGQKLVRMKYRRYSEAWDHDHCCACNVKFSELETPDYQHEGYTTGPEYPKGREYEWVCVRCFNELKDDMGWTVVFDENASKLP